MISLITPVHKIIPWWNLRIISVCKQTYKDWEWIILDNAQTPVAQDYLNQFFLSEVGSQYIDCKSKIKVTYNPFTEYTLATGRIGKLKNTLVDLTTTSDNEFFLVYDYDDFLTPRFLEYVDRISKSFDVDLITGDFTTTLGYDLNLDRFINHTLQYDWIKSGDNQYRENIEYVRYLYNSDQGFRKFYEDYSERRIDNKKIISTKDYIDLDLFEFNFDTRQTLTGYNLFTSAGNPILFRKSAFRNLGGFNEFGSIEDSILYYQATTELTIGYLNYFCYIQTILIGDDGILQNSSNLRDVLDNKFIDFHYNELNKLIHERVSKCGGWDKPIKPKYIVTINDEYGSCN